MSDLPLVERPTCGCGHHDEELPVLDARAIPHAIRHAAILGSLASLTPGRAMALVAPHDPLPLLAQIKPTPTATRWRWATCERGPESWTLTFTRI